MVTAAAFVAPPIDSLTSGLTPKEQASVNHVRDQAAEAIAAALTALGLTAVAVSFMQAISARGALNFDQELLRVLRTTVDRGLAEGWTADETAIAIQQTFQGVSSTTAQMLAQTELTTLVNERSLEAAQKSVEDTTAPLYKRWQTMKDARVRVAHATTEGQTVPVAQPFNVGGYGMMYPGDPSAPMALVARCFPAGTLVAGSVEAAVRSTFEGRMVTLHTRSGGRLSGTENHPVLTFSGWKALGEVEEGDHLICAGFDQGAMGGAFDVEHTPARIEEVFDSLMELGCPQGVRAVDVDLYGDTLDGDVDVVWSDSLLELPCTPSGFKPTEKFAFAHSDEAKTSLAFLRMEREFLGRGDAPASSSLGFGNARLTFIGGEPAHSQEHRLGATATLDPPFGQTSLDRLSADAHPRRDLVLGEHLINVEPHDLIGVDGKSVTSPVDTSFLQVIEDGLVVDPELLTNLGRGQACRVQTDDVVAVDSFTSHYEVFTLSTEQGYYIANGYVVGNCRCRMTYTESLTASAKEDMLMSMTETTTGDPVATAYVKILPDFSDFATAMQEEASRVASSVTVTINDGVESEVADEAAAPMADGPAWKALLAIEGVATEDGRMLAEGSLTWRDLPLTLTAMDTSNHGAEGEAKVAGRIDTIWRDGSEVWGEGVFNTDEFGTHIYELVSNQSLRGNSIEPAVLSYEIRNRETGEVLEGEAIYEAMLNDVPLLTVFLEAVIMCSTVVATPALADANIILAGGILKTSWCSWLDEEPPLTASAAGMAPLHPPLAWYENPRFTGPTPLTVTPEGRVMGHAALWNSCHIGEPSGPGVCVPPPRSGMQYEIFHHGVVTTEEGVDVPCGQITMSTFHAGRDLSWKATLEHYEHSGCAVADVIAGEDRFGIWVSGGLRPDLAAERVRELKAGSLSGDWRDVIGRGLEFLAALIVNIPGFPIPRAEARITASAAGEEIVLALVAAGIVSEEDVEGMSRQEYLRKIGALTR